MKKNTIYSVLALTLIFTLYSCIEEYSVATQILKSNPEIVIQGRILTDEESVVYVSRAQPFGSDEKTEYIPNAKVRVIGQNGYKSNDAKYDTERNCYLVDTKGLQANTLYAIQVEADNEVFQSHYLSILETPDIEELAYKERTDGISIHISAEVNEEASRYYMWSYEEDWEFHASIDFLGIRGFPVYEKKFYPLGYVNGCNPYLYCWQHTDSSEILLYGTNNLDMNLVKEHELLRIPIDDIRISYIYSILVKQFSISEEAYIYYSQLKKLTEENSSLFTPMPMELKGNVECISNPSINVRGYVLASNVKTKRIFIYESEFQTIHSEYEPECFWETPDPENIYWQSKWYQLIMNQGAIAITKDGDIHGDEYLSNVLYHRGCVDCRETKGATKKRPDFWPNNHE